MPPMGFKPVILGTERPQTHALESATTGIGHVGKIAKVYNIAHTNVFPAVMRYPKHSWFVSYLSENSVLWFEILISHNQKL